MSNKKSSELIVNTQDGGRENVRCVSLLRIVPGKREVYDAIWQNKPVIAKIFFDRLRAKRHLKRELEGLNNLKKLKINAPEVLLSGTTDEGERILVTEKITGSVSAIDAFLAAAGKEEKLKLLLAVCREIARENESGVLQKDLHLGNFLIKENNIYAIDVAQMRFFNRALTRAQSTGQLAFPASHLADELDAVKDMAEEYFKTRGWPFEKSDENILLMDIERVRKRYIKSALKKSLRTSKNFLKMKSGQYEGVFDKSFIGETEPMDFIKRIDSLMDGGQILKRGNTSYVSRINFNGKDVVVKRYNHKGLIHSLRHTILRSRARRCWLNGQLLLMLNVATPKPVAFIEIYKGVILWQSYLATEYVEGRHYGDFLKDPNISEDKKAQTLNQINDLLERMGRFKITHSDLKPSNIIVSQNGPVLTDLDALKIYKLDFIYKHKHERNIRRVKNII